MKVSRRSWHYRLYRYTSSIPKGPRYLNPFAKVERRDPSPPASLCPYAWAIFLGLLGTFAIAALLTLAAPVFAAFFVLRYAAVAAAWAAFAIWDGLRPRRGKRDPFRYEKKERRGGSVVREFAKARKDKVCPVIELVD